MADEDESFAATIAATNSNLSRLSKTVTATATSLVTGSVPDVANSHFHHAMKEIAARPQYQRRLFSFNSRRTPTELVKSTLNSKEEIRFRAVTAIPEDMLRDIPASTSQFSLFQGFQATNEHDEDQSGLKKLKDGSHPADPFATVSKLNHKLDLLEIRKDLAANEIKEIDQRIEHLQSMRKIVFDRVAKLEQEEFKLENELRQASARAAATPEPATTPQLPTGNGLFTSPGSPSGGGSPFSTPTSTSTPTTLGVDAPEVDEEALMSQSIYGKLQSTGPGGPGSAGGAKKKRLMSGDRSRRKTMPTLQQFYQPGKSIRSFNAHSDAITALDFDVPFGTMVSASQDDSVLVWDLSRAQVTNRLVGHNASVKCVQIDDNYVVTGSADASLKLWDVDDEAEPLIDSYEAHVGEVTALHFYGSTLVSGSADKTIRQWDMNVGKCLQTLDIVWAAAQTYSSQLPDSKIQHRRTASSMAEATADFVGAVQCYDAALATGTADGIVRLWDLRSGQVHRTLVGHTGPVTCLQFDEYHLATGSTDRSIRIWDLRTGTIYDAFAYENPITSLHFDARRVVSATGDSTVKIYDREAGKHWTCGPGDEGEEAVINRVRYREGYIIEGRTSGDVGVWAA